MLAAIAESAAQVSLPQYTVCCCCRTGNESAIHKVLLGLSSLAPEHLRNHNPSQDSQHQPNSSFSTYSTATKQATSAHNLQSATLAVILMCPEERSAREEILLRLVSLLESMSGQQKLLVAASLFRCIFSPSKSHEAVEHSSDLQVCKDAMSLQIHSALLA